MSRHVRLAASMAFGWAGGTALAYGAVQRAVSSHGLISSRPKEEGAVVAPYSDMLFRKKHANASLSG